MTSNFKQYKDGSSSGFIKKYDGTIDQWDKPAGTYSNVGTVLQVNSGDNNDK